MLHWSPSNTSTVCKALLSEPLPPAIINTPGDLALTDDVESRLVGIGGSDGCQSFPVSLVSSRSVTSRVERRYPPTATNLSW